MESAKHANVFPQRRVTLGFEAVSPPATSSGTVRASGSRLESTRAESGDALAERVAELESENALLREEVRVLRAARLRSPSAPYSSVAPPADVVYTPKQSGARRVSR